MSRSRARVWRFLVVSLWLGACGGAFGQRSVGGESHFLHECEDGCSGGLECVSGVCTRGCLLGKGKCNDLSPSAVCTDASIEPGAIAVCDVACDGDTGCSELGLGFQCLAGFCREQSPSGAAGTPGAAGTSGAAGSATTAGTSSSAGAGGGPGGSVEPDLYVTPNCSGEVSATPCPADFACVGDPRTVASTEPTGICVQKSVVGACADDENACPAGFECVNGSCSPEGVDCVAPYTCDIADQPACPYGYARSRVGVVNGVASCTGPCVPLTHCDCAGDDGCPGGSLCRAGRCLAKLPWQPPRQCALPFDSGTCDALLRAYAVVLGVCTQVTYGGCGGNDNRFSSLEECMAVCEGKPVPGSCPEGRVESLICSECAVDTPGGCGKRFTACALPCTTDDECRPSGMSCQDGVCQAGPCI